MSLVSSAVSRSSSAASSTVRVRATMSSILRRKRLAGARNGLLHAAEKARFGPGISFRDRSVLRRRFLPVIVSAKKPDDLHVQL